MPTTPAERAAAAAIVVAETGLDPRLVPRPALHGLLRRWWEAGWSPAGVLHALAHRPGEPDGPDRGDLTHGTDPADRAAVVRVMGGRLRAWIGHADELPATVRGRTITELAAHTAALEHAVVAGESRRAHRELLGHTPTATATVRTIALADIRRALTRRRHPRRTNHVRLSRQPDLTEHKSSHT